MTRITIGECSSLEHDAARLRADAALAEECGDQERAQELRDEAREIDRFLQGVPDRYDED